MLPPHHPLYLFLREHPELRDKQRWKIFLRDGKCCVCSLPIDNVLLRILRAQSYYAPCAVVNGEIVWFNIDHIKPRSSGGTNEYINLRTTCHPCNEKKGDKLIFVSDNNLVPSDYESEILKRFSNKQVENSYPEWKPYYGY